jgi:hypothetical protein
VVVECVGELVSVLDVDAAPFLLQRGVKEASAGVHRVATVLVLGQLLVAGCPAFDIRLLAEAVTTKLIALFFHFPWNNILQAGLSQCFIVCETCSCHCLLYCWLLL